MGESNCAPAAENLALTRLLNSAGTSSKNGRITVKGFFSFHQTSDDGKRGYKPCCTFAFWSHPLRKRIPDQEEFFKWKKGHFPQ
jgi:hypothetical protein